MSLTKENTPSECALIQLPNETIFAILLASDPEDVLFGLEKTCKTLHLLSDSKRLWMTFLANLDYDQSPDVGPHIELVSLQTKDIKRLVIRAKRSYKNWCSSCPQVTREQKVELESHHGVVKVFPGCRYILAANSDYFGVWDITRERIIARYLFSGRLMLIEHGCALLGGGKIARVAIWRGTRHANGEIEVVDLDLDSGNATLLFSQKVSLIKNNWSPQVREEAVIAKNFDYVFLLNPETGKCAKIRVSASNHDDVDQIEVDIVRGTLVCMVKTIHGSISLYVAKLSRVFLHTLDTPAELILANICENSLELTAIPQIRYSDPYAFSVCDPTCWGSAQPCRILLMGILPRDEEVSNNRVQAHRLYLKENDDGSNLVLTYDSSSKRIPLEEGWIEPRIAASSISGRCTVTFDPHYTYIQTPGGRLFKNAKYDIMASRLWKDDVHLYPSGEDRYDGKQTTERYSGTQVWYHMDAFNSCVLHFFD